MVKSDIDETRCSWKYCNSDRRLVVVVFFFFSFCGVVTPQHTLTKLYGSLVQIKIKVEFWKPVWSDPQALTKEAKWPFTHLCHILFFFLFFFFFFILCCSVNCIQSCSTHIKYLYCVCIYFGSWVRSENSVLFDWWPTMWKKCHSLIWQETPPTFYSDHLWSLVKPAYATITDDQEPANSLCRLLVTKWRFCRFCIYFKVVPSSHFPLLEDFIFQFPLSCILVFTLSSLLVLAVTV